MGVAAVEAVSVGNVSITDMLSPHRETAMSGLPSPLKSAAAIPAGYEPATGCEARKNRRKGPVAVTEKYVKTARALGTRDRDIRDAIPIEIVDGHRRRIASHREAGARRVEGPIAVPQEN